MSRRKQANPQHVQLNGLYMDDDDVDTSLENAPANVPSPLVCDQCCEEFSTPWDLKQHERECASNPQVLIVKESGDLFHHDNYCPVDLISATTGWGQQPQLEEWVNHFEMEEHISSHGSPGKKEGKAALEDCSRCRSSHCCLKSPDNTSSSYTSSIENETDSSFSTTAFKVSLPLSRGYSRPDDSPWKNSSVIIENLESTKVAVAQFTQRAQLDNCCGGTGTFSSLLEQILALQVQQIQQLRLTNQICHHVLLFASEKAEIPECPVSCDQEASSLKTGDPLIDLSSNLSQQLAVAAGIAQCLDNQSANLTEFKRSATHQQSIGSRDVLLQSDSLQSLRRLVTSTIQKQFSKTKYTNYGYPNPQLNCLTSSKAPSLALSEDNFINQTSKSLHFTHSLSTSQLQINCNPVINIGAIVEDLDALTVIAEEKNNNSINATLSEPKAASNNAFFKHRCRFCAKLFGSDSALQIHLRSHTGERPYKCNICGNRFSTRGNLKVHFQRHKECYPHIQMNPYPIPQHLDNIPTSTGIPYGMSMLPEKTFTRWFHSKPYPGNIATTSKSFQPLGLTKQPHLIKREGQSSLFPASCTQDLVHLNSKVEPTMPTDSAETVQGSIMTRNCKREERSSLNFMFEMSTSRLEESKDLVANDISSSCTNSNSVKGTPSLKMSETSKLRLLLEDIDKKVTDSNECVICHRILSCHSALRMHYRTHTGERPYPCKLCGRAFSTKGNLKTHQAVHRTASKLTVQHSCPICQKKFTNAVILQQHVRLHTDGHVYAAPISDQDIPETIEFNGGFGEKWNSDELIDFSEDSTEGFCDSVSSNVRSLSCTLSTSVSDTNPCDSEASGRGPTQPNWIKTEREQEAPEEGCHTYNLPTIDNHCTGEFSFSECLPSKQSPYSSSQALCHLNSAESEEPFQTNVSSTTSKFIETSVAPSDLILLNHIKDTSISGPGICERGIFKNTACDICGKTFACQSALDIHYRSHTKERPFICTTCSRGFSTKGNLKQHLLTHQMRDLPSSLFELSNPNKTSNTDPAPYSAASPFLATEVPAFPHGLPANKRVSSALPWNTSAAISSPGSTVLARRMAKQHHCRTCGKTFSSSSALQIHNRTHTGEKPFACSVCRRAFTTKGNLKVHMGTHMWNSAPARKGRRLFTNGSMVPTSNSPARLPTLPQKKPAATSQLGGTVYPWKESMDPLGLGRAVRTNDLSVFQRKEMCYLYGPTGLKERPPVEDIGVSLDKLLFLDQTDSLTMNQKNKDLLMFPSQI